MQVSDCEQLMRATLRAARILCTLRGMHHIGIDGVDINIDAWLARADSIELLDENAHKDVARAFFVDMLSHATKSVLFGIEASRHAEPLTPTSETGARTRRRAASSAPERQAIALPDEIVLPDRLLRYYNRFIAHLHPLVFIAHGDAVRPHARLDYRLALVVHCGQRLQLIKKTITESLQLLRELRTTHADSLGGADCPARLFVIVWRDQFHPLYGEQTQTTKLYNDVRDIGVGVASEHLSIELHNVLELQYDAVHHERVPRHVAVERATEPGIATISDAQFPTLLLSDPQTKLHDFRVGQIIRIERRDIELGCDEIAYRIVRTHHLQQLINE